MELTIKNFNICSFTEKYDFQRGDFTKNRRDCLKKGIGQFADLRGGELVKKEGVVCFEGG